MNCTVNFPETKVFKEIAKRYGTNKTAVTNLILAVSNPDPKVGVPFEEYYKEVMDTDITLEELLNNENNIDNIIDVIENYYQYVKPSVAATTDSKKSKDIATLKGYSDTDARNEGIKRACEFIFIQQSLDRIDDHIEFEGNGNKYVKNALRQIISDKVVSRICDLRGIDKTSDAYFDVYDEYDAAKAESINKFIDFINTEFANGNIQDKNLAALCLEIMDDSTIDSFISEMIASNGEIGKIISNVKELKDTSKEKQDNVEATEETLDTNESLPDESTTEAEEHNLDYTTKNANNHLGAYSDFKMHVDDNIRTFLSAIYVLDSTEKVNGNYVYNLDNKLGLPSLMDVNQLMNILYTCVDYTNGKTMLESIKTIADQIPGMQGLIQVFDKLNTDSDLRYAFYRTFGKSIVSKLETVLNGDEITTRISNRRSDRLTSIYFEYFNSAKRTCIGLNEEVGNELLEEIRQKRKDVLQLLNSKFKNDAEILKAELISDITNALRRHCPSIDVQAITNFINNHPTDNDRFSDNSTLLINIIDSLNEAAAKSRDIYNQKLNAVITAKAENRKLRESGYVNEKQLYDEVSPFSTDYATDMEAPTQQLAKLFVNYAVVKTELNSRNVQGNLSSDVINSSMITNIMKTLQNEVALKNFGEYKSLSNQYNLSNILVEKKDASGKIINLGLFRIKGGKFVPTEYAHDLLKVRLFNGAGNPDSGENALYSQMTKGDYVATSLVNFFDRSRDNGSLSEYGISDIRLGSYFMKTPSDAPKNFIINAPVYGTGTTGSTGLFRFENSNTQSDINSFIQKTLGLRVQNARLNGDAWYKFALETIASIKNNPILQGASELTEMAAKAKLQQRLNTSKQEFIQHIANKSKDQGGLETSRVPIKSVDELVDQMMNLTGKDTDTVTIRRGQFKIYPTRKYSADSQVLQSIAFRTITEDGEETYYFIEGTLVERNSVEQLTNAKFAGFLSYNVNPAFNKINPEIVNAFSEKVTQDWIKSGKAKRVVNVEHPIFQQIKNAFIQELTDAATALNKIFVTDPVGKNTDFGCVNFREVEENGVTKNVFAFREGYDNTEKSGRKLYKIYHVDKSSKILKEKDGVYSLTGAVFNSDRFIYTDRTTGKTRNFGEEILNETFNLLYGGEQGNYIHTAIVDGRFVAVPTEEQMKVINEKLAEFLNLYIQDSMARVDTIVSKYNGLPSYYSSVDAVTEWAANYLVTYIGFNDLFEGDSKFYKDSQDILKRAKEVQGSGVPYGTFDITRPFATPDNLDGEYGNLGEPLSDSILNDPETSFIAYDSEGNSREFKISHHPRFVGVTIANSAVIGKTIGEFVKVGDNYKFKDKNSMGVLSQRLYNIFLSQNYTPKEAFEKTEAMMSNYCGVKANDAQSYITFEEWIRRITARGQYTKYRPLIDKILDERQELTTDDIREFIQVQKNFYYDQYYNPELGVTAPRQIKNAEFVLVPRFIKGTELETVYNLMKKYNIDQLNTEETSKAGKCKVLSLWNNDGVLDKNNIKDFEETVEQDGFKEYFDYNYLYTQSETPQHMATTNKAAIQIMKKIVDNVPYEVDANGNPTGLYKKKLEFFDLYSENIHDNFEELMDDFGIQIDSNGNIVLENGEIPNIDYDIFFKRLDDEFRRQGLDSNLREYITQKDKGSKDTNMPLDMGSFSAKLESIAQSLFNSKITRQTLPGYHAAQITNVGWSKEQIKTDDSLKYHPDSKHPYVEIMLPRSAFKLSDEMQALPDEKLIKVLEKEGLDKSIGYRIPTEGKQSICIFKLKGFISPALGSTIVVPNDWVAQTGSDFDIDSVYGIMPEYYHDKDGHIHKIKFNEVPDLYDWYRYINRNADKKQNYKLKDTIKSFDSEIQDELNAEMDTYQEEEHEYYETLHSSLKKKIKEALAEIKSRKTESNRQENYLEMLAEEYQLTQDWLDEYEDDITEEEYNNAANFAQACRKIAFHIENAKDNFDNAKREKINTLVQQTKENFEKAAKDNGLMSYEEFIKNPVQANTRKQRNNRILDNMISILQNDNSLEENLSVSGFSDINDAKDICYAGTVEEKLRKNRSSYNFLDQSDYQEDAMSGAMLKAMSVKRDTFVSICNTARTIVAKSHEIKVSYPYDANLYKRMKDAYNENEEKNVYKHKDSIIVHHNRLGWSLNNHNVVDKILTSYDSQTTAYILDAIKSGAIPNVNDRTFKVYKTFTDLGGSHLLSVAFMMQPGVRKIVQHYNANNSIYQYGNNNCIHSAIKEIARELGIKINGELVSPKTKINDIINAINKNDDLIQRFNELFNDSKELYQIDLGDTAKMSTMSINVTKLIDRIKTDINSITPVERIDCLLQDLFVVLQYNKIEKLANRIESHASVMNPDKFGAKQTIYATRKVFKDINRLIELENENPTLIAKNTDGKPVSLMEAIYPGITESMEDYMSKDFGRSVYPPLNAFLKYATATSIKINKGLFLTQSDIFINHIEELIDAFSHNGNITILNEKTYNDYKNYILNKIYSNIPIIQYPIGFAHSTDDNVDLLINIAEDIVDEDNNIIPTRRFYRFNYGVNLTAKENENIVENERRRIYGYRYSIKTDLHVEDMSVPKEEELEVFLNYTPAQKVAWIQENFNDAGIFKYIEVNTNNSRNTRLQRLSFNEDIISPEAAYTLFKEAFYNSNPFVKLAAYDLIKYAFVVEGFKMRRNGIAKKIVNEILVNDTTAGITVIDSVKNSIRKLDDSETGIDFEYTQRNYIRAHSNMNTISTKMIDRKDKKFFESRHEGMIELSIQNSKNSDDNDILDMYNISYTDDAGNKLFNKYVKLKDNRNSETVLYEIITSQTDDKVYLVPLNKLDETENSEFSVNEANNKYLSRDYYETLINLIDDSKINKATDAQIKEIIDNFNKEHKKEYTFQKPPVVTDRTAKDFEFTDYEVSRLVRNNFESENPIETYYFISEPLTRDRVIPTTGTHDSNTGEIFCSIQTLNVNGVDKQFKIVRVNPKEYWRKIVGDAKDIHTGNKSLDDVLKKCNEFRGLSNSIYYAEEFNPVDTSTLEKNETRQSSVSEKMVTSGIKGMLGQSNNPEAAKALSRLDNKDISISKNNNNVGAHLSDAIEINAEYVTNFVDKIINNCKYFCKDEEGNYHSITDDYSIQLIKSDVAARQRYIKLINDARGIVKNYKLIQNLDIDAEDNADRKNLRIIREKISEIDNNILINQAEIRFTNDYLSKLSTNPLVKSDIITLLDGYHSTSWFDCYIADLQENSNPLIQIVTKEAMADIRGKEALAKKRRVEFVKAVNHIIDVAKAAGKPIDISKIVDDSGRFIQSYSNTLVDDMNALREKVEKAKEQHGIGSNEYQLAKMEYEQWKLDYIHQEAPDDYYRLRLQNLRNCLIDANDPSKGFEPVYLKYCELSARRFNILSHMTADGVLDEEYKKQLKKVNRELDNLHSPEIIDENGNFIQRYGVNDPSNPYTSDFDKEVYKPGANNILRNFISENKKIRDIYYEYDTKFGFEEELEKNLNILNSYPKDEFGNYVTPLDVLMQDETFANAKEWIDNNATRIIPPHIARDLNNAYATLKSKKVGSKLRQIAKERDAYDSSGVIDATKLTDEDIQKIFEEQADKFKYDYTNPFSDNTLMSAAVRPNVIYKTEFYRGLLRDASKNPEWVRCINDINNILKKVYSRNTGRIETSQLSYDDLKQLNELYNELADLRKYSSTEGGKRVFEFMSNNVEAVYDEETFEREKEFAKANYGENTLEYIEWLKANTELQRDLEGNIVTDDDGHPIIKPNHFLYGYIKPNNDSFIDTEKTNALQTILAHTETVYTPYYYKKLAEMRKKSVDEYNAWYKANHIYNPYKHCTEPLPCWYQTRVKSDITSNELKIDDFAPRWLQTESKLKDEFIMKDSEGNPYYKKGYGHAFNYKHAISEKDKANIPEEIFADPDVPISGKYKYTRKDNKYDNHVRRTSFENELKTLMEETLLQLATTGKARRYIEKGYLPMRAKGPVHDKKYWTRQALEFVGWSYSHSGNELWFEDESIDYSRDREITMPMLNYLGQRQLIKIPENASEEEKADLTKQNEEIQAQNDKIKNEILDKDWIGTIEEFILQAGHYNAVQDNKQLLFFAKNMIDRMEIFDKKVGQSDLHMNKADSTEENPIYVTKKDKRLQDQYVNWLRRLLYEQYKEPNDALTRAGNILQSLTSSKFMMMNITGGISNVTLGFNQIMGEAFAKEYFGTTEWKEAHKVYKGGLIDYMSNAYSEKSNTLAGALIKFFDVVDFDEIRGVVHDTLDFGNALDRFRSLMFSPQTAGEHYMQNTAMFAMMRSHRIIANNDPNVQREYIAGLPNHKIMTEQQYIQYALENKVKELIGADRFKQFNEFKKSITKDPNDTKDYAWFRKDALTEFIRTKLTDEEKNKYIEAKKDITEKAKEEFNKSPLFIDQFELNSTSGTIAFKDGSLLSELPEQDAYKLLGEFKGRVISVNKKIHGVYDRLGAAKIESSWWGSLVMQYHKHLYPGIMKRYRRQGYWNEERGTVEKGMFWSIIDLISIPLDDTNAEYKALPENEQNALKAVQIFGKQCVNFITNWSINWNLLPDYEKANIKRNLGDLIGWASAIMCAIALRGIGGDDDKDKFANIMYNLSLYEADRLASESFMYNPIGLISEARTLWSTPLACQSEVTDLVTALGEIGQMLIQGDDYNGVYQTGLYAGESKAAVRLRRQIPIWRALERVWNLDKSNKYYKIGTTGTGIVPVKPIGDALHDAIY